MAKGGIPITEKYRRRIEAQKALIHDQSISATALAAKVGGCCSIHYACRLIADILDDWAVGDDTLLDARRERAATRHEHLAKIALEEAEKAKTVRDNLEAIKVCSGEWQQANKLRGLYVEKHEIGGAPGGTPVAVQVVVANENARQLTERIIAGDNT